MGNTRSLPSDDDNHSDDLWWNNNNNNRQTVGSSSARVDGIPVILLEEPPPQASELSAEDLESLEERTNHRNRLKEELDEFKVELARKHQKHREIIANKHREMQNLREEVARLRLENQKLKETAPAAAIVDRIRSNSNEQEEEQDEDLAGALSEIKSRNLELKMQIAAMQKDLQELNGEVLNFEKEREDYKAHVVALKDVVSVSKQMLLIRESQLKELREKVKEIEASLAGKELTALSQDLRHEYEKQLQNIRNLRVHYEERQRADRKEKDELIRVLNETKKELADQRAKNSELEETNQRLEEESSKKYDEIKSLESNLGLTRAECRQFQSELSVINQLFSQFLLGFNNSQEFDIDKLILSLQENHHILQDIAINEDSNQVSALPKVLLDLVNEINDKKQPIEEENQLSEQSEEEKGSNSDASTSHQQLNSASEIVENLPKVWKVLIELLSHQTAPILLPAPKNDNPCYNVVETPKGPSLVLSVSKTFIRLKDLILEKKSLERETYRLKHLNTHLECRLQEQEKRLETVSSELTETWHVVGKLQKKHQMLHTQEKILRYELAQKRKLLTELKEELEYSREKWQEAREKNSTTEKQWEQLRIEFASRKNGTCDDYSNSVESGYSDDKECSSEDEPGYETDVSECNNNNNSSNINNDKGISEEQENQTNIVEVIQEEIEAISANLQSEDADDASLKTELDLENVSQEIVQLEAIPASCSSVSDSASASASTSENAFDRVLSAREERLSRLEGQCSSLVKQVTSTSSRSTAIASKLDALHEIYGDNSRRTEDSSSSSNVSADNEVGKVPVDGEVSDVVEEETEQH